MTDLQTLILIDAGDPELSANVCHIAKRRLAAYEDIRILPTPSVALPAGAMASDAFTVGALALAVLPTLLPVVINAIKDIKIQHRSASIKIKIKKDDAEIEVEIPQDIPPENLDDLLQSITNKID